MLSILINSITVLVNNMDWTDEERNLGIINLYFQNIKNYQIQVLSYFYIGEMALQWLLPDSYSVEIKGLNNELVRPKY